MPEPYAGFRPTAPPEARRSTERPWDEALRPSVPDHDSDATYDERTHGPGRQLIAVHDHLRAELTQILDLVEQVGAGRVDVAGARDAISQMTLRQNDWTLGAYCASYCRVVATHHTIEDQSLFPQLTAQQPATAPVVERLSAEHHVIHEVLERVDAGLVALVTEGGTLAELRAATDLLHDTLLSHLSYEEHQLVGPLSQLGFI